MAIVTFYKNPLAVGDRETIEYEKEVTLKKAMSDLKTGKNNFIVDINGKKPKKVSLNKKLKLNDVVNINICLHGGQGEANTQGKITSGLTALVGVALVASGVGSAAGVGLIVSGTLGFVSAVINRIPTNQNNNVRTPDKRDSSTTPIYSLNAAGNEARSFQSLPLCLSGEGVRAYPDFGANPYNGYVFGRTKVLDECKWGPPQYDFKQNPFTDNYSMVTVPNSNYHGAIDRYNPPGFAANSVGNQIVGLTSNLNNLIETVNINTGWLSVFEYEELVPLNNSNSGYKEDSSPNNPLVRMIYPLFIGFIDFDNVYKVLHFSEFVPYTTAIQHNINNPTDLVEVPEINIVTATSGGYCLEYQSLLESEDTIRINVQRSYHIFNYGFGDCELSDHRIINTDLNDNNDTITNLETFYRNSRLTFPVRTNNSWDLPGPLPNEVFSEDVNYEGNLLDSRAPYNNVMTIEGGILTNARVNYPGTITGPSGDVGVADQSEYNWMFREGPDHCFMFEIDIEYKLFEINNINGVIGDSVKIEIQYRDRDAAGAWTALPIVTLCANDTNVVRQTVSSGRITNAQNEIRIRKQTFDPDQNNKTHDINVSAIRFMRSTTSDVDFTGENRVGLDITADAQVNGNVGRYSALIKNKCWVYDPNTDSWNWGFSSNPADLYLYYLRGGFYNETANGNLSYPFSPTFGWVNSADHPDSGERMWGCGLQEKRIDLDSIKAWWVFCNDQELTFDHFYTQETSCYEVLEAISGAGRASPSWANGSLGVVFEDPDEPISSVYGMFNIIKDSFSISYTHSDLADEIIGQYIDREDEWISRETKALMPTAQNGVNQTRINLIGITTERNAQREVNLLAARQYYQRRTISFETDIEGFCNIRGDVIGIQHDLAQWEFSSRASKISVEDGKIVSACIMCEIEKDVSDAILRLPDGDLIDLSISADGKTISINTDLDAALGPQSLDDEFTENASSLFPDTCPEDFILFIGSTPTPYKKARITDIETVDQNTIKITAVDEDPAIYSREYVNVSPENATDVYKDEDQTHIRPCAKIVDVCYAITEAGAKVSWETDGAIGAEVYVTVNNNAEYQLMGASGFTQYGNCAEIVVGPGDQVTVRVEPVSTGSFDSENGTISFEVPNG